MRFVSTSLLLASAMLLSACVGGMVMPGGDDEISVDVDGYNPQEMQQRADSMCAKHDNMYAVLKNSKMDATMNGQRHNHYDCTKRDQDKS